MRIVADPQIPLVTQAFAQFGEVRVVPGREISSATVEDADALLIRSVTRVDRDLLGGSRVSFVGTATSGVDHIDREDLAGRGIVFADASGSNANSVAEYVVSAILRLTEQRVRTLDSLTAAVIGCGKIGTLVARKLRALNINCLLNDPPLKACTKDPRYLDLTDVLGADILTLHVPLTRQGNHSTWSLIDSEIMSRMGRETIVINAARGGVVDETALLRYLRMGRLSTVVDCWLDEPEFNLELLAKADLGTPHIAGYSHDGKVKATVMLYRALCGSLGVIPEWQPPSGDMTRALEIGDDLSDEDAIREAVRNCYDIRRDAQKMASLLNGPAAARGRGFDALRSDYPMRREFSATSVRIGSGRPELADKLKGLGFVVEMVDREVRER